MAEMYEWIAAYYGYFPGVAYLFRFLYRGVETVCGELTPMALFFYQLLGYCVGG